MATFVIVELERTQQGTYVEGQKRFEWTSDNRALPRGQIETSLELKKTRDENAAGEPDIQVLAVADGDWSIEGEWSDRFGGQGFAERMREEIEDLARRSSRCRFSIDSFVSDGLLDKVTIRYRLKRYQELTGADLAETEDAFCVWWALQREEVGHDGDAAARLLDQ